MLPAVGAALVGKRPPDSASGCDLRDGKSDMQTCTDTIGDKQNNGRRRVISIARDRLHLRLVFHLMLAMIAGILPTASSSAQAPAKSADQLLQQADQSLQKQDYVAAAQALEAYLAKKPDDYRAEFNLAYAYSMSSRRAEAIERYKNVLARQPDLVLAHLNLGMLLVQDGSPGEAADHLQIAVKQQPDNRNANLYLAEALAALKRVPEASDAYEQALKLKPDDARVHLDYAKVLQESNPAAAEEHLRRALQIDPGLEEAWLRLAALLESRAKENDTALREAAEIYRNDLENHPERRDLRIRLGELDIMQKNFAAAAEQFEAARSGGDKSLPLAKELLQAYLNLSDADEAGRKPEREKLLAHLNNSGAEPNAERNAAQNDGGKYQEKEMALLREILAAEPRNAEMHLLQGRLWMKSKKYNDAAAEFNQAAQLQPQSAEAYTNLASAFYLQGEYETTIGALAKVSALQQDTAGTYFLRAICLDKLHVIKPALENYQRFLALDEGKNPDQDFQARQRSRIIILDIKKGIGGRK